MSRRGDDLRITRTIQAVLDDGLEALGLEMAKMKDLAQREKTPLIDHQAAKLCNYVRATVIMAEQERKERAAPAKDGDLVAQIADALKDPVLHAEVMARMKEGRAS